MKPIYFIYPLLLLITCLSCSSVKDTTLRKEEIIKTKKEWKDTFKAMVVYSCMCELTDNQSRDTFKSKGDVSFTQSGFFLDDASIVADSLGRKLAREIKPPYKTGDFSDRKAIFTSCLFLQDNKTVIKASKSEYKKHIKVKRR